MRINYDVESFLVTIRCYLDISEPSPCRDCLFKKNNISCISYRGDNDISFKQLIRKKILDAGYENIHAIIRKYLVSMDIKIDDRDSLYRKIKQILFEENKNGN